MLYNIVFNASLLITNTYSASVLFIMINDLYKTGFGYHPLYRKLTLNSFINPGFFIGFTCGVLYIIKGKPLLV